MLDSFTEGSSVSSTKKPTMWHEFKTRNQDGKRVRVRVDLCTEKMVRVRTAPDKIESGIHGFFIVRERWPGCKHQVRAEEDKVTIETSTLVVNINKQPLQIAIFKKGDPKPLLILEGTKFPEPPELATTDVEGEAIATYQVGPSQKEIPGIYIPTTVKSFFLNSRGFGVLRRALAERRSGNGVLDFYVIYGPSLKEVLNVYVELTGRPPLIPKWAFGPRFGGYWTQNQIEEYARMLRAKHIPANSLHVDSSWLDQYMNWKFCRNHFPDPEAMLQRLHNEHFKFVVWNAPLCNPVTEYYDEIIENEYEAKTPEGKPFLIRWWHSPPDGSGGAVLDFSKLETVAWWKEKIRKLIRMGVDALKTDAASFYFIRDNVVLHNGMSGSKARQFYALLWHRAASEVLAEMSEGRFCILSKTLDYPGHQRYPAVWSGDFTATFDALRRNIEWGSAVSSAAISYWTQDTGAIGGTPTPELFVRWAQFATFNPITFFFGSGKPRLPWIYGSEAENIIRDYLQLRMQLLPYIYSIAFESWQTGVPIVRPMYLEFQDDNEAYTKYNQFMFGPWFLVAPIYQASTDGKGTVTRSIYLPEGEWTDYWTGEKYRGPKTIQYTADLRTMPLFVRSGAIIPMGPIMDYTSQKQLVNLTVDIYLGADTDFHLFEDDGTSLRYQRGEYALTEITQRNRPGELEIIVGQRQGGYAGMPNRKTIILQVHCPQPASIEVDGKYVSKEYLKEEGICRIVLPGEYKGSQHVILRFEKADLFPIKEIK